MTIRRRKNETEQEFLERFLERKLGTENKANRFCIDCGKRIVAYKRSIRCKRCSLLQNKIACSRYRANLRKVRHVFTDAEWLNKLKLSKGICPMCGENVGILNLTLDHIYPISKAEDGRIYTIDDVQPLCKPCNSSKRDRIGINTKIFRKIYKGYIPY